MSLQDLARAAGISVEDEELLALLLAEEGVELDVSDSIPRLPGRAEAPLSFAQERLWFLDRLTPGSATYNIPSAVRLTGSLRLGVFTRCWREILGRHDSLRTHFETREGVPVQVIDPRPTPGSELVQVDLSALPAERRRGSAQRLVREEAARPFDLEHGPVARAVLLKLDPGEHVLLLNLHHIVSDGWSMGVLVREVAVLYDAFFRGLPSPLPEPEIQYADFSDWQRSHLVGEVLEAELAYWRERLSGAPALALPTDRPRPALPSYVGETIPFALPESGLAPLRRLTEEQGATLFMTLLAALDVLFARYTGQDDVVLGSMIANRNRPEIEGLIGFFINGLTLRSDLTGDPSFRTLLDRVREIALGAFAHQDLPFEKLVAEVQPGRDLSRSPLFQVVFLLQNTPSSALQLPGLTLEMVGTEAKMAKFDLQITVSESPRGLVGSFNYSTDLFDRTTIVRLGEHLQTLLAGVAADPDRPISWLPVIPAAERQQVLGEWNETGDVPERGSCLHDLFAAQAARTPAATALVDGRRRWSYAALDAGSNRLARQLRRLGVGPEVRVGLCLARSGRMVAAMLAVLKAGGAYVGLDPRYPKDRLAFMLADAAATVLLTEEGQLAVLPEHAVPTVLLDDASFLNSGTVEGAESALPLPRDGRSAAPGNLAYLIYTSGSTGRPKGVAIEHASAAAMVGWAREVFPASALAGVLASTSICFDLSVFEIFVPLAGGGAVIVAENALALPNLPAAGEVTLLNTVPSAIAGLVRGGTLPLAAAIVNLAGEALKRDLVEEIYRQPGVREVRNLYGPSEDTTYSTWTVVASDRSGSARQPRQPSQPEIGRPIRGSRAYLLDGGLKPVPLGAVGELYLAGAGLARGYLGRPDLTADRFVPDPFSEAGGGRLYRTGDLARYRPAGALDYLGRIDHQVKVRGFRIELGEIEAALAARPEIAESVVLAREDGGGGQRLVAYVVARAGTPAEALAELPGSLASALAETLPEYMVPAVFLLLPALPLTANGKVDRQALPAPEASAPLDRVRVMPRDGVEELLARLWAEVLGLALSEVGVEEDFFALGGSSITSAVLVNRLQALLGEVVPVIAVFQARTIARLAARLAADQPAAVARLLGIAMPEIGGAAGSEAGSLRIPARFWAPGDTAPLSYSQERLWFLDQLDPGRATYNIPFALRLRGRLDLPALAAALTGIVSRQAVLRTTFAARDEVPVQVVGPVVAIVPPLADLSALPAGRRDREAVRLAGAEVMRPFDLARGPLFRATLLRLQVGNEGGEPEHALLLNLHHITSDGWSTGVLVREMAALYTAHASGAAGSPLPPLPIQYADFALWQRGWLDGAELDRQLAWWRQLLAGAPALLELPTDRPRPPVQTVRGGHWAFSLPEGLSRDLAARAQEVEATPFMALLAAYGALLGRWGNAEDVVVGTPVANRQRAEVEGLIGFFVNTLAVRVELGGSPSFRTLAARVREVALGAFSHQDLPFEKLVVELAPERSLGHSPLFQVLLVFQNAPTSRLELPDLTLEPQPSEEATAKFDLTLSLSPRPGGLAGGVEYNRDLFDPTTVARFVTQLERLLQGAVADPEAPLADLPLLSPAERHQLLREWNSALGTSGTPGIAGRGASLPELLAARAAAHPGAPAVAGGGEALTYAQLLARVEALAWRLHAAGVGPGRRVGICLERSPDLVVGLLATLWAGGAYVTLDPAYPAERLSFLVADSAAAVILTRSELLGRLPAGGPAVLLLDRLEEEESTGGFLPMGGPDDLLYVIYTSGSTGQPKGAGVYQRGFLNLLRWYVEEFGLAADDRFLVFTSASFDLTQKNFFAPLFVGGLLVLAETGPYDPREIAATVERHRITRLNCTPSAFYPLIEDGGSERLASLRTVFLGGEPIGTARLAPWRRSAGRHTELVNTYGPTECTDVVAFHRLAAPDAAGVGPVPVGRPLPGFRLLVLDRRLAPLPVGAAGQLAVSGEGVGAGYLGRPELTAEKFVPDPFAAAPGARLYWTGDLARVLPGGEIDFLGRIDHQIKVRGFRVELQEIEAVLAEQPGVVESAVLVAADAAGDGRLVAYVVPREPAAGPALVQGLRDELRLRLPDYMVPSHFVPLERLPLTPNGKVDRKALAALRAAALPASGSAAGEWGERGGLAPRTPVEELLAAIWAQILGVPEVGANDNFFDLGGHSLLATRMVSRIAETFGVELPLRRIFESPVLAAQAAQIAAAQADRETPAPPIVPLPLASREAGLPLSFAQERLWFIDQFEPGRATYNVPTALRAVGTLDVGLLAAALSEVVRRHESLRTTFAVVSGQAVQVIAPARAVPLPVVDLSGLPAEVGGRLAERLLAAGAWRPFDLATGPLLRALALRLGPAEHALLLTMHHIVSDGWSMEILIREIATLYRAFFEGRPSPLPPLPVQYADFAVWQRRWLTGEVLAAQLAYWRERLAGAPPVLDLPLDHPRPAVHTWNGERLGRPLPPALGESLREVARRGQATLFMALLAVWDALLLRWTGQSDLSVGTPIAGRTHREVEGLIGFFVNTLVLRTRLAGRPGYGDILKQAREAALGAYAHQDVPLEKLVEELAVERSLEHTPLFQVMLIVQQGGAAGTAGGAGGADGAGDLTLPGLVLSPLGSDSRTAKFDLTLIFQPSGSGLQAVLGYNTDLFRRDTVLRLLGQLEGLLAGMVAEPERPVAELPLLTLPERHQLLLGWNDTPVTAPVDSAELCLHQHFEGWAARRPEAPAAVLDGDLLTYGDLDLRAGRLAARLRRLGVGLEVRVGLCLPRSFDLLTALLAVLKAGGAYVPLDPANPRDRLLFLLADSRVPVLLTVRGLAGELGVPLEPGADSPTRVICLDEEPTEETGRDEMPAAKAGPDNLAYVIYTSGSTGTPNGVLVPHRGAVNLIREAASLYRVTPESRVLQTASVGFDASVLEIFLALAHGASLCLVREEERLTPAVLADRLSEQKVTTAVVTPSLLSVLAESRLGNLRAISVGGEACPAELAARWAPGRQFLNCYGPTEATIFATVAVLSGREEKITIGRPVGNVLAYVVDRELLPLPIGAVGELVVGGVGLARGYLDRPEKTALKFVPDPLSGQPGERLYRTGDLARFTPAGEIEFLGRLDDQVKVRGFRIELGEIEAALLRHPGIQAAVVLAPADAQGERKLIAYAAGPAESRPTDSELRAFLAEHLPEYMVPVHLVLLDALPTTPGGKVDRRALPDPAGSRPEAGEHVEPRTAAERFVAGLWRQVLGIERVSATDDFFALGGNSIKGAILTNLLQEKLGEYVYVVALFDAPTLGALARYLEENYTEALERVTGETVRVSGGGGGWVEPAMLVTLREVIPPLAPKTASAPKNRRAVFLLSPPRSGSTLLRVMLAGNPALFAPPELELLGFNTLAERKAALSGRWALWQEGTIRALMEVYACDAEEARRRMDEAEARGLTVQQLYGELQDAIGGRLLVDKTPSYALDPATLARAEEDFAEPLYVHLLRHPYGMIRSFEKAKLEQVFFRPSHPFTRRQLAELIWDLSQENILDLLSRVPAERQIQLRFEEMLKAPEREMRRVCEFLGVPFDPGMLDPYADRAQRMTDGIHQLSKMVGDVKFHEHKGIEAQTADSWRREIEEDFLGDVTWDLAATLGYRERVAEPREPRPGFSALVPIQPQGTLPPLYLVHPVGGNVLCYAELSRRLGEDQPVYGLQALGLSPGVPGVVTAPQETVEAMAASYVAAIRAAQPRGPYRLGGWSIGGVIAYEMAHQLRNAGEEVELLALFDSLAPVRSRGLESAGETAEPTVEPTVEPDDALLLAGLARDLGGLSGRPVTIAPAELAGLDPEAGLARVIERVRAAGALPPGFSAEQIGRLWRVFRANVRAVRAYTPRPAAGRTALFVTLGNPERDSLGTDLGWGRLVGDGLAVSDLPGDHYSLLREPGVQELADRLRQWLEARCLEASA
jgi:amino acid adenylation domain-containing protein